MEANRKAFLDMIAFSEGTSTNRATRCNGYDVIVTGADGKPEVFTDFSTHPFAKGRPSKVINSKGLTSNASGRYQFMLKDWAHYKALLHLTDFGPVSQDLWAIQLIRERAALPLIDMGNFDAAAKAASNLWASLPGAGYGQRENALDTLRAFYVSAGGQLYGAPPAAGQGEDTEDDSTSWGNEASAMKLQHPSTTDPHYAWFDCPACGRKHAINTGPGGWVWNGDAEKPTLTPSVRVTGGGDPTYRCHSFVTDGRIQFLDDCSHALRGWHELPEMQA